MMEGMTTRPRRRQGEPAVYDRVSLNLAQACERYSLPKLLMRWRICVEMTPHYAGSGHSRLIVRYAESETWHRQALRLGLAGSPREAWPLDPIVDVMAEPPAVYSFISCSLRQAADRTGVSESTLSRAIADGWLTAHRIGEGQRKIVIRAQDLDEWVQSLPTSSPAERSWRR